MRTTALVFGALLCAGSALAQSNIYSVNVVGYTTLSLPSGYSMIANQLDNGQSNKVVDLFGTPAFNVAVFKFNGSGYTTTSFDAEEGSWAGDLNATLAPGEGAFVLVSGAQSVTFTGDVMQGNLVRPIPQGYSIVSSMVPQQGRLQTDLGFDPSLGASVNKFVSGSYVPYAFDAEEGAWAPSEPSMNIGESFFLLSAASTSWNRTFNVQ